MQAEPLRPRWPARLWVVRHGQSAGNVARDAAHAAGLTHIEVASRDADVPLSELGQAQAAALGRWFAGRADAERPDVVLQSPYVRARQTAEAVRAAGGVAARLRCWRVDERLREKEFGVLDRLTTAGIAQLFPDQAEHRRLLGKFYHRPPGGESWCDVILRLRSLLDTLSLHHAGERVLIVAHQVVVLCLRYLLENLEEAEILAIDREGDVANCGVTEYRFNLEPAPTGSLQLHAYNVTAPVEQAGAPVTVQPDAAVAVR